MFLRSSCEEASGYSYTLGGFWWTTVGAGSGDIRSSDGGLHDTWSGVYWTGEPEAGSWSGPGRLEMMVVGLIMASREKGPSSKGMGHFSMPEIEKEGTSLDRILQLVVGRWQDFSSGRSAMRSSSISVLLTGCSSGCPAALARLDEAFFARYSSRRRLLLRWRELSNVWGRVLPEGVVAPLELQRMLTYTPLAVFSHLQAGSPKPSPRRKTEAIASGTSIKTMFQVRNVQTGAPVVDERKNSQLVVRCKILTRGGRATVTKTKRPVFLPAQACKLPAAHWWWRSPSESPLADSSSLARCCLWVYFW